MRASIRSVLLGLAVLLICLRPGPYAQTTDEVTPAPSNPSTSPAIGMQGELRLLASSSVTTGMLHNKIDEISSAEDLDETVRNRLTELYRRALSSLEAFKSHEAKAAGYAKTLETAPKETTEIRSRLEAEPPEPDPAPLPPDLSIKDMETRLAKLQADIAAVEVKLGQIEKEIRSSPPVSIDTLRTLPAAVGWLVSPHNWLGAVEALVAEATTSPIMWALLLVVLLLLWKARAIRAHP